MECIQLCGKYKPEKERLYHNIIEKSVIDSVKVSVEVNSNESEQSSSSISLPFPQLIVIIGLLPLILVRKKVNYRAVIGE